MSDADALSPQAMPVWRSIKRDHVLEGLDLDHVREASQGKQ